MHELHHIIIQSYNNLEVEDALRASSTSIKTSIKSRSNILWVARDLNPEQIG